MNARTRLVLFAWMAGACVLPASERVNAQSPPVDPAVVTPRSIPAVMPPSTATGAPGQVVIDDAQSCLFTAAPAPRIYGSLDYLLWWVKGAPLSVPLVTTGPISTTHHGFLNSSDTTILYGAPFPPGMGGNDTQNFPGFSGGRLTLGYWLNDEQQIGIEGSGFALQRQSAGFQIRADSTGTPIISIPVFNNIPYSPGGRRGGLPPNEDGLPAALPSDVNRFDGNSGVFTGGVKITNSLRLWGTDMRGVISLFRTPTWQISGLAGIKYLDLSETFNLSYDSTGVSGVYVGKSGALNDTFQTRNHFLGGTMGLHGRYTQGSLFVDLSGSVALGANEEVSNVWGAFVARNFNGPFSTGPEGVFAQPANEGRRSANKFAVVPEAQIKIGYAVTSWMHATVGYDFVYASNVLRPGDQLNRNLPKGQTFNQGLAAPSTTSPSPLFNTTDFFAHGLSFGLDFSY